MRTYEEIWVATFCAQCHFRLLCSVIQSSMPSAFIWSSASCVHLFIHATQVSVVSSLSIVVVGMLSCCPGLLSTSSGSESESVVVLLLWVIRCGGGCSSPNQTNPTQPEYYKPIKPKNNSGCYSSCNLTKEIVKERIVRKGCYVRYKTNS